MLLHVCVILHLIVESLLAFGAREDRSAKTTTIHLVQLLLAEGLHCLVVLLFVVHNSMIYKWNFTYDISACGHK